MTLIEAATADDDLRADLAPGGVVPLGADVVVGRAEGVRPDHDRLAAEIGGGVRGELGVAGGRVDGPDHLGTERHQLPTFEHFQGRAAPAPGRRDGLFAGETGEHGRILMLGRIAVLKAHGDPGLVACRLGVFGTAETLIGRAVKLVVAEQP